jgi:tetratricopeptide (TPR) repeat protein
MATTASGFGVRGDFSEAMARLRSIDGASDFDVTWWRTVGYLNLAREGSLTREQRLEALAAARVSADGISGWKRAEALHGVAEQYGALGEKAKVKEALETSEAMALALPDTMPTRSPLLALVAGAWGKAGERERATALLKKAEAGTPATLVIDQPGIYAAIASTYTAVGDPKEAARLYDVAFRSAEGLLNARPRALSTVEIARSMARAGFEIDEATRGRFERLFSGLGDPW